MLVEQVHEALGLRCREQGARGQQILGQIPGQGEPGLAPEAAQDGPLRGQSPAAGVHEREHRLPPEQLEDGAERPAALQLHRDRSERLGRRGGAHVAGRGERDRREGPPDETEAEAVREGPKAGHQAARQGSRQVERLEAARQFEIQTFPLEGLPGTV